MEIDGPHNVLNTIFDAAEAGIPGFAKELWRKGMRKGIKHKGVFTGILIDFGLTLMRSAIASGIELGNNGLTVEQYKAWWKQYSDEKLKQFCKFSPDELKAFIKEKGLDGSW
jgi:hypothetical protein